MRRRLLPYQIVLGITTAAIGGIAALLGGLRDEFGFTNSEVGVVVAAGFLAAFGAQIMLAPLADRGHGRAMAITGLGFATVALAAMAVADSLTAWILARALLGFGGGLILPGVRRAVSVLDPARVGENLGRLVAGEVVGFMIGPVLAAGLAETGSIRTPFAVLGLLLALFIPVAVRLPDDTGRLDTKRRLSFDLLRRRRFVGALFLVAGYFVLIGAFESVIPLMFRDRGASTLTTGIAFTVLALPVALTAPLGGRTADRLNPTKVAMVSISVVAITAAFYGVLPGINLLVLVMFVAGVADGFGFVAAHVAVSRAVPEDRQAGALGLMGATEVGAAGLAAIPAAILYDTIGDDWTWVILATIVLAIVGASHFLIRGTSPTTTVEMSHR